MFDALMFGGLFGFRAVYEGRFCNTTGMQRLIKQLFASISARAGPDPSGLWTGVHWLSGRLDYPLRLRGSPAISRLASRPRVFPAQHDYGLPVDVPVATRGVPPQRLRPPSAPLPSGPLKLSHLLLPSLILAATRRTPLQECYGLLLRVPEGALGVAPEDDADVVARRLPPLPPGGLQPLLFRAHGTPMKTEYQITPVATSKISHSGQRLPPPSTKARASKPSQTVANTGRTTSTTAASFSPLTTRHPPSLRAQPASMRLSGGINVRCPAPPRGARRPPPLLAPPLLQRFRLLSAALRYRPRERHEALVEALVFLEGTCIARHNGLRQPQALAFKRRYLLSQPGFLVSASHSPCSFASTARSTSKAGPRGYRRPVSGLRQYASGDPSITTLCQPASTSRRLSSSRTSL